MSAGIIIGDLVMGKFFSMDGAFFRVMTKVADYMILTFFTIICSLGVITIGAAITSFFYVGMKMAYDEEGGITKSYFNSFKENFIQSALAEIIVVAVVILMKIVMNVTYEWSIKTGETFPRLIYFAQLGICIVLIGGLIYLFAMIARFKNSTFNIVKNSLAMAVKHAPQTIIMLILNGLLLISTLNYPLLWPVDVGVIGFVDSFILARVFKLYMPKPKVEGEADEVSEESEETEVAKIEENADNTASEENE